METPLNILLVEDNDIDVMIVKRALKKLGETGVLLRAHSGQEALDILKLQQQKDVISHPFVVLLDLNMPGMSGHEFLKHLRQTPDIADVRVIVLSTSDAEKDVQLAYARHANGYIVKPTSTDDLSKSLEGVRSFWRACAHPPPRRVDRPRPGPA